MIQNSVVQGGGGSVEWKDLPVTIGYAPPMPVKGTASITFDELPVVIVVACMTQSDITSNLAECCVIYNSEHPLAKISPKESVKMANNSSIYYDDSVTVVGNTVSFQLTAATDNGNYFEYKYYAIYQ